jgi:hypothetical protein
MPLTELTDYLNLYNDYVKAKAEAEKLASSGKGGGGTTNTKDGQVVGQVNKGFFKG